MICVLVIKLFNYFSSIHSSMICNASLAEISVHSIHKLPIVKFQSSFGSQLPLLDCRLLSLPTNTNFQLFSREVVPTAIIFLSG